MRCRHSERREELGQFLLCRVEAKSLWSGSLSDLTTSLIHVWHNSPRDLLTIFLPILAILPYAFFFVPHGSMDK